MPNSVLLSDNKLINALGFQCVWWSLILFGDLAVPVCSALLACHFYFYSKPATELKVVLFCAIAGFMVDTTLTLAGVFQFNHQAIFAYPPLWLLFLWFGFSATIRNSLNYFRSHNILASVLGGISGTTSYLAAERLGAVDFPFGIINTSAILIPLWAVLFPTLIFISKKAEQSYVERNA